MKLASTTADFRTIDKHDHLEKVRHIAKAGFKYVDLSFYDVTNTKEGPFMQDDFASYVKKLKDLADELGVTYVQCHLPGFNPLNESQYEAFLKCTNRCIEVSGMLGIKEAVIHTGTKEGVDKYEYFKLNYEALKPLFPMMEKYGVNVLIENSCKPNMVNKYFFFTGKDMKEFIDYVNHPLIHACWDLGHANIEGHQYEDIMALGDDLHAIHVHDNNGKGDEHQALFSGTLNIDEVMTGLIDSGYKGYFTFEADSSASYGQTWQLSRHKFEKSTILFNPNTEILDAAERYNYETGKAVLRAYGVFED